MALGLESINSTCGGNVGGSGMTGRTTLPANSHSEMNGAEDYSRSKSYNRPRDTSKDQTGSIRPKFKWSLEQHQSFIRTVNRLGGKYKATPMKILKHMDVRDGSITGNLVKSHLRAYRKRKSNDGRMSNTDTLQVVDCDPAQSKPTSKELFDEHEEDLNEDERDAWEALHLFKEVRNFGARGIETTLQKADLADIQAFKHHETCDSERLQGDVQIGEFILAVELNDDYRSNSRPSLLLELFQHETSRDGNLMDVVDSLSGSKTKAEEVIELNLTLATGSPSPKLQLLRPSTLEEAALILGLS